MTFVAGSIWKKLTKFFFYISKEKVHYTKYYKFHLFDKKNHLSSALYRLHIKYRIFKKKNLDCGGMKRKFFSSSEKEEEEKEHGRKKWKLFFLFTLRLEKIEQSYSIKNFLSNQLFFRNFLVLYFSTCCKNDDVLENLMVQTVDVRMNVVCKPINQKYYTIYILYLFLILYISLHVPFLLKKNPCYMYVFRRTFVS